MPPSAIPVGGPPPLDDAALARRIAAADALAHAEEAELCRRYMRRLVAFGRRHLGSADRAQDLAQDTLLLTLDKLRSDAVREPEKIGSFILGVARTLAATHRSRDSRHEPLGEADAELVAPLPEPPDPIARSRVKGCLEALPDKHRAVVVLSFYAEQSSSAIAASLGLSSENVRVIRHRGVARLRDCLGLEGAAA
jgi:RNA polymerase sigma-70 factor (ECF subfamily)